MPQTNGTWRTLLQGVSQRPDALRDDHHEEQVNTLADPVRGMVRRPGSVSLVEQPLPALNGVDLGTWGTYRVYDWHRPGKGVTRVVYRTGPGAGPAIWTHNHEGHVRTYRIADKTPVGVAGEDQYVALIEQSGIASVCAAGGYLAIAPAGMVSAGGHANSDLAGDYEKSWEASRRAAHISFRSLSPNTRYRFLLEMVNVATGSTIISRTLEYVTPPAAYPGKLSTGGVQQYIQSSGPVVRSAESADFQMMDFPGGGRCAGHTLTKGQFAPANLTVTGWTNVWPAMPAPGSTTFAYAAGSTVLYAPESWADNANNPDSWFMFGYDHNAVVPNPAYTVTIQRLQQQYNEAVLKWQEDLAVALQPSVAASAITTQLVTGMPPYSVSTSYDTCSGGVVLATLGGAAAANCLLRFSLLPHVPGAEWSSPAPGQVQICNDLVSSVDQLPLRALPGLTVKVQPPGSPDAYFMTAYQEGYTTASSTALTKNVVWREGTDSKRTIIGGVVWGTMRDTGPAPANTPTQEHLLIGSAYHLPRGVSLTAVDQPVRRDLARQVAREKADTAAATATSLAPYGPSRMAARRTGDDQTNPQPKFVGQQITHLASYQGRLLVCSGGTVNISRAEDYSDFWRSTVLTVRDSDGYHISSRGNEDDTLIASTDSPNGLIIAGGRNLYRLPEDTAMSPVNARMPVYAAQTGTQGLTSFANEVFSATSSPAGMGVLSAVPTDSSGTARSTDQSAEVLSYLRGSYRGMMILPRPSTLVLVPSAANTLYLMSFADGPQGRVQRAWHRWYFSEHCGTLLGASVRDEQELLLYFHRQSADGRAFLAVDSVSLDPRVSSTPYLDAQRPLALVLADEGAVGQLDPRPAFIVFSTGQLKYVGTTLAGAEELLDAYPTGEEPVVGFGMSSYVTLTSPHIRDRDGRRVDDGNLSISNVRATFQQSSGVIATVDTHVVTVTPKEYTARLTGAAGNEVGNEPVRDYQQRFAIGRNRADYNLTLEARDWRPWGITALSWGGVYTRRY